MERLSKDDLVCLIEAQAAQITLLTARIEVPSFFVPFFTVMRERRPFVVLKAAMSADDSSIGESATTDPL